MAGFNSEYTGVEMPAYHGFWYEHIVHTNTKGIYSGIWIDERLKDKIVEEDIWIDEGTGVKEFMGADNTLGTIIFQFRSQNEMDSIVDEIDKCIKVIVK